MRCLPFSFLLALLSGTALAQPAPCSPPQAIQGSVGCQPPLGTPQTGDLVLGWRPSLYPGSAGTFTTDNLTQNTLAGVPALIAPLGQKIEDFHQASDADWGAAVQRACTAGAPIWLGPQVYPVSNFTGCNVASFVMRGIPGKSIIQRQNANVGATFFGIQAASIFIDGITFDANKAAVTANQWGVLLNHGGQTVSVRHSIFKNNSGSLGSCFALTSTGPAAGGSFAFVDNEVTGCGAQGTMFASVSNGVIRGNSVHDNAATGITINSIGTASPTNYATAISVIGNTIVRNSTGVAVGGFGPPYVWANILPSADGVLVQGNTFTDNVTGVSNQGDHVSVIGNLFTQQNVTPTVSILCNSRYGIMQANTINTQGSGWGLDCGGAIDPTIVDNQITVTTGSAIDPGGTINGIVRRNHIILPGTAFSVAVGALDVEGDGNGVPFPQHTYNLDISDNLIEMLTNASQGIRISDNAGGENPAGNVPVQVRNNHFVAPIGGVGGFTSNAIQYWAGGASIIIGGNTWNGTSQAFVNPGASTDLVLDNVFDQATTFSTAGGTLIRAVNPPLIQTYNSGGSFLWVHTTAGGSGYTSATTLTAHCSGTDPTGVVMNPNISQGSIFSVRVTNVGSGCAGTPSVTATDSGGGSGASFTAQNIPTMLTGRQLIVSSSSPTMVLKSGGGATSLLPSQSYVIKSNTPYLHLTGVGTNNWLAWQDRLPQFTLTTIPPNNNSTCTSDYNGAEVEVTNSATGKWLARCNGTNWLFPDGTTVN